MVVDLRGRSWAGVRASVLAADDIHDHNTFEQPDVITGPVDLATSVADGRVTVTLPAASVAKITGSL